SDRKGAVWEDSWTVIVENRGPFAVAKIDMVKQSIEEQPIILSAEGSFDRDGEIVGYYWDYGDGTHSDENKGIDGYETGYTKAHDYEQVGTYYVEVYVKDDDGKNSEEPAVIQVIIFGDPPEPTPIGAEVIIGGLLGTVALLGVLSSSFVWLRKRD
ncbi:MAG: PKD domain-containing protein, partial [Thermoplasmata archaeon]|nr:PKD domain-containing protein [Thermoplasmata archaeon]